MCQKICLYVTSGLESQVYHLQAPKSCSWHLIFLALSVPTVRISEALLSFYLYFLKQTPAPIHLSKQWCFLALGPSFLQEQTFLQALRKRLPWNPSPSCRPDRVPASLCLGRSPQLQPAPTIETSSCRVPLAVPPRDPPRSGHPRWEMTSEQGPGWLLGMIPKSLGFEVRLPWAGDWSPPLASRATVPP